MGWKDTFTEGLHRVSEEAERVFDKGKSKVEELQTEMHMDGLARKLGYLSYDAHRGRKVDEATRVRLLMDLTRLEDTLEEARKDAAAKAAAERSAKEGRRY
jgi:hypothetical protein